MTDKEIRTWIAVLMTAYEKPLNKVMVNEYLENMRDWNLGAEQWHRVKYLAKERLEFFPRVSQLREIAQEVRHEDDARNQADSLRYKQEQWKAEASQ
jgi:hypothetical protein